MPLYDYKCSACGVVREHRQKISDEALTECPECGGEYKRIITSVGIIFKGSGFHINDYRGGASSSEGGDKPGAEKKSDEKKSDEKKSDESASSGGDSKGETKPSQSSSSSEGQRVA
jgi:putative FmdB family regulatory protein